MTILDVSSIKGTNPITLDSTSLIASGGGSDHWGAVRADSLRTDPGAYYFEVTILNKDTSPTSAVGNAIGVAVDTVAASAPIGFSGWTESVGYLDFGQIHGVSSISGNGLIESGQGNFIPGDVVGVMYSIDGPFGKYVAFFLNGAIQGFPIELSAFADFYPTLAMFRSSSMSVNFNPSSIPLIPFDMIPTGFSDTDAVAWDDGVVEPEPEPEPETPAEAIDPNLKRLSLAYTREVVSSTSSEGDPLQSPIQLAAHGYRLPLHEAGVLETSLSDLLLALDSSNNWNWQLNVNGVINRNQITGASGAIPSSSLNLSSIQSFEELAEALTIQGRVVKRNIPFKFTWAGDRFVINAVDHIEGVGASDSQSFNTLDYINTIVFESYVTYGTSSLAPLLGFTDSSDNVQGRTLDAEGRIASSNYIYSGEVNGDVPIEGGIHVVANNQLTSTSLDGITSYVAAAQAIESAISGSTVIFNGERFYMSLPGITEVLNEGIAVGLKLPYSQGASLVLPVGQEVPSLFEITSAVSSILNPGLPDYDQFPATSYAYISPDRPVRYKGELIEGQAVARDSEGQLYFDIIPNSLEDNGIEFNYIVSIYGPQARLIHKVKITMPDEDSLVWDLLPLEEEATYSFTPLENISE